MSLRKVVNKALFLRQVATPRKIANLIVKEVQSRTGATVLSYFPSKLTIDIGNVCNLRCPLCPTGRRDEGAKRGFMTFENYRRVIDEIGPYLTNLQLHNWGEPLLNKDLVAMVRYAKERRIPVSISTNLTVLTPEVAEGLMATRLEKIFISLDAATAETYSTYRVGGDFNQVVENIRMLVAARKRAGNTYTRLRLLFHVFRHNEHELEAVRELARQLELELMVDRMRTDMGKEIFDTPREAIERDGAWIPENPEFTPFEMGSGEKKAITSCHDPWSTAVINWEGSVLPCCAVYGDKYSFGNALKGPFAKVWNSENYQRARKEILNRIDNSGTICHTCRQHGYLHF